MQTRQVLRGMRTCWRSTQAIRHDGCAARAARVRTYAEQPNKHALIQGASRGLGLEVVAQLLQCPTYRVTATCRDPGASEGLQALQRQHGDRLHMHRMDVTDAQSIAQCAKAVEAHSSHLDLLFNVAAVLHIPGKMAPETALSRIEPDNILLSFQTNAIGPTLVAQHFLPLLQAARERPGGGDPERPAVVANMSARVGSIGDNGLGGWYSYRASKAALNQLTKTMSLEFARRKTNVACVLVHPGTCDTGLSEPFQRNVPEGKLFSRERGARQLLELIDGVTMGNTGRFVAWDGQEIPW